MDFRLIYEGPLKSKRGAVDKQAIRRHFHGQLVELLKRPSMAHVARRISALIADNKFPVVGGFQFAPIISSHVNAVARLHITMLIGEEPGVTKGGDIDNRLKTLLDALRMPHVANEIPPGDAPRPEETPLYCLLEDDAHISAIAVDSDRLLRIGKDPSDVVLLVRVTPVSTISALATVSWT